MVNPSPYRLVRRGWIHITDVGRMTLDDVDLWCLYLDAVEEAEHQSAKRRREESES